MISNASNNDDIEQQLHEFLDAANTLMLATVNGAGLPEASYAPYMEHKGCLFIFISGLASHTENLLQSGVASVLLMEAQSDGHAFTRKRLSCVIKASAIAREDDLFESVMQLMEDQFGNLITTLRGLADFQLFQLKPTKGNFVAGFGQAFEVDFPLGGRIRHRNPD
jgi:putative heme iron utilization protein